MSAFPNRDFGELMLMRVTNDLGHARQGGEFLRRTLRVTSGHNNLRAGIFAVHATNGGARVLVSGRGNGTGVKNYDFRLHRASRAIQSSLLKLAFDGSAVSLRRAAAEILYVKICHGTIVAAHLVAKTFVPLVKMLAAPGDVPAISWARFPRLRRF